VVVGIDPGQVGAYAVLDSDGGCLVDDLPVFHVKSGKTTRSELDPIQLANVFGSIANTLDHVFMEKVGARPGQGVTSMFRFGYASGLIHGVVAGTSVPFTFVTPQVWQRVLKVASSPDAARQRACELYPSIAPRLNLQAHQHRADALLIAHWGLTTLTNASTTTVAAA
jgi:crossover junction endodeoxyribonuclease RuvC